MYSSGTNSHWIPPKNKFDEKLPKVRKCDKCLPNFVQDHANPIQLVGLDMNGIVEHDA